MINYNNIDDNHIFLYIDASDWCLDAVLFYSSTFETAHSVAYDSYQLAPVQLNYSIYKKKLLAVVYTLKK